MAKRLSKRQLALRRETLTFLCNPCRSVPLILAVLGTLVISVAAAGNSCYREQKELARLQPEIEKQKLRLNAAEVEDRRDAVMRLGALRRAEASRAAMPALTDLSPIVRVAAAIAVGSLPADENAALLAPLLIDKDPFVRQEVAYALGSAHNHRAVAALIERLSVDKEAGVRGAAAVALGMIGDEVAIVPLAQVLSPASSTPRGARRTKVKENGFVMRAVAHALGEIRSRAGVPALIEVLSNDSLADDIRREAAQSLGQIADPSASPALRAAMSGHDPHLSRIALQALHKIELAKAQP